MSTIVDKELKHIPEWYIKTLIEVDNDCLILDWELDDSNRFHKGYCKFCHVLLYNDAMGSGIDEYKHMIGEHPEEIAIYRLGTL